MARHSVWSHIAPQVAKQITAALKPESKGFLVERIIALFRDDAAIRVKFEEEEIEPIDIRKVLDEIFMTEPLLGMPIDAVSADLREWASTSVKLETKLWIVRKHVELGNPGNVIYELPEELPDVFDSQEEDEVASPGGMASYEVSVQDFVAGGFLAPGSKLTMSYKRER